MSTLAELAVPGAVRKPYKAEIWLPVNLDFVFEVQFSAGSHVKTTWQFDGDGNDACKSGGAPCVFPFRNSGSPILYYGCTHDTSKCALAIDADFVATSTGTCTANCHKQRKSSN